MSKNNVVEKLEKLEKIISLDLSGAQMRVNGLRCNSAMIYPTLIGYIVEDELGKTYHDDMMARAILIELSSNKYAMKSSILLSMVQILAEHGDYQSSSFIMHNMHDALFEVRGERCILIIGPHVWRVNLVKDTVTMLINNEYIIREPNKNTNHLHAIDELRVMLIQIGTLSVSNMGSVY